MTLIALMGLPGCGKSTLATALETRVRATTFREPEEQEWPEYVKKHMLVGTGAVATFLFFRSIRVAQLVEATSISRTGALALVDCYYDKLLAQYIDHPAMAWFLDSADPSFADIRRTADSDYEILPDADDLIFISVTPERWQIHLERRGRGMDNQKAFRESFTLQGAMREAAERWAADRGRRLLHVEYDESAADRVDAVVSAIQNLQP